MDFQTRMNNAFDYIEEHLLEKIDYDQLAEIAGLSRYNFQRFFTYASGIALSEYIKRRRLSCAALDLQKSGMKIIDLAYKYGYESALSFSRAFQAFHGTTPTDAMGGHPVKSFPKMEIDFSIKDNTELIYRIESKPGVRMIGIKESVEKHSLGSLKQIPEIWNAYVDERKELAAKSKENGKDIYGVSMNYSADAFDYYLAVISDDDTDEKYTEIKMPELRWAIFKCVGPLPDAQISCLRKIFTEWLPTSGYEIVETAEVEWYPDGDIFSKDYMCEIWIPIKHK